MNDSLAVDIFNTSFSLGVEIGSYCLIFVVVGCLWNKRRLLILARSIVIVCRTRCKRGCATKQCGGQKYKEYLPHIYLF